MATSFISLARNPRRRRSIAPFVLTLASSAQRAQGTAMRGPDVASSFRPLAESIVKAPEREAPKVDRPDTTSSAPELTTSPMLSSLLQGANQQSMAIPQAISSAQLIGGTSLTNTGRRSGGKARGRARGRAATVGGSRYPLARAGRVIGTPYKGTHTLGNWQSDNAVDLRVPVGTPMTALEPGKVVRVRHHPQDGGRFAGDQITIRGKSGQEYFYAHGVARVKPGQHLRQGQVIGRSGSANGVPHLHLGVMKGNALHMIQKLRKAHR